MRIVIVVIAFLVTGFLSACEKEDPQPDPVFHANSFTAMVDGKAFYAEVISAGMVGTDLLVSGTRNAGNSKAVTISLYVSRYAGLSSYPIDTATTARYTEPGVLQDAASGIIHVTTDNDVHIEGTFSFVTSGSTAKVITNGKFDIYK